MTLENKERALFSATGPSRNTLPRRSILLKTIVLSWLVTVVTICIFTFSVIPQQKRSLLDSLKSKADLVATSIADVAASAIVIEDYSAVVDHCIQIVGEGDSVPYIVITRNDGFSLIHRASGWESKEMKGRWTPLRPREPLGGIEEIELVGQEVYHFSHPFDYSGIEWGWIHIGLSLDQYNAEAEAVYMRTALLGLTCVLIGLMATIFYARRLVKPIHALTDTTVRVASGDFAARAQALWLLLPAAVVVGQGLWNAVLGLSNDLVNPRLPARLAARFADQAPVVAGHLVEKMLLDPVATQLLFALFALFLGLFFRRLAASELGPFAAVVILALGADFLVYASTIHDVRWHLGTSCAHGPGGRGAGAAARPG